MKALFLLLAALGFTAAAAQADTAKPVLFTPAQVQADLDSLYRNLQENHPALFLHWSQKEADRAFAALRNGVKKPLSRQEVVRLVSPFVARFRDGHTFVSVEFTGEDILSYAREGAFFPVPVQIIGEQLFVAGTGGAATSLRAGDEITRINGKPSREVIRTMKAFWSADGDVPAAATASRLFGYGLWAVYGWGTTTKIEFRNESGFHQEDLAGISREALLAATFQQGGHRRLQLFPADDLALVSIHSYSSLQASRDFIDSCFRVIREAGIKHVALDLRRNGGGNSAIGDYFLAHISRQPYSTVAAKQWRIGPLVAGLPQTHWISAALERDRKTYRQEGQFLVSPAFNREAPAPLKDSSLFVPVKLFLLTSPRTYSSAHMTALAVKCGGLGTIVGEPTGERLDLTGEILEFRLPHTKIAVVTPTAIYRTACGEGSQIGVQPDHFVPLTSEDLRKERDAALEKVKELIRAVRAKD